VKFTEAQLESVILELLEAECYPPVDRDEVYKEIFEQAENFKKHQGA
jgi:type I restriction enzyme R subunit